jgi:hypothetical protein
MRLSTTICLLLTVSLTTGCGRTLIGSRAALCDGTAAATDVLAQTVVERQPHPDVRIAAAELIVKLDAGCGR